jgi:hypothetical protein
MGGKNVVGLFLIGLGVVATGVVDGSVAAVVATLAACICMYMIVYVYVKSSRKKEEYPVLLCVYACRCIDAYVCI